MSGQVTFRWAQLLGVALTVALISVGQAAAQGEGHKRAKEVVKKIEESAKEMKETRKRFEKALEGYESILAAGAGDRQSRYKGLVKEQEKCEERIKKLKERGKEMKKQADKFYKEWRKRFPLLVNRRPLHALVSCYYTIGLHKNLGYPVLYNDFHAVFFKDVEGRIRDLLWRGLVSTNWHGDYEVWDGFGRRP